MDISYVVAEYLQKNGFGTIGTNLFVGYNPDTTAGVFIDRIGGLPNKYVPIDESVVNIYVKNTSGSEAIQTITSIKNFIHRMHNTTQSEAYVYTFLIIGDVEDVARDMEYSKVYKITLQVVYTDTGIIS